MSMTGLRMRWGTGPVKVGAITGDVAVSDRYLPDKFTECRRLRQNVFDHLGEGNQRRIELTAEAHIAAGPVTERGRNGAGGVGKVSTNELIDFSSGSQGPRNGRFAFHKAAAFAANGFS